MATQFVIGLYESKGYAQDARNRLHTEGVPHGDMALVVLREIAPVPQATRESELAALSVDPLILGDVENTFARFIRNGETAVIVGAATMADVEFVRDVMALYDPLAIDVLPAKRGATVK